MEEIKRQQKVIREVVEQRPYADVIDASEGIDATVQKVRDRVIQLFLSKHGVG